MTRGKIKVLYIAGSSRSGSTILGNILGQIDGFFHVGELFHIWQRGFIENWKCGCGNPFRECDVWNAVVDKAFGNINQVDPHKMLSLSRTFARARCIPFFIPISVFFKGRLNEYLGNLEKLYDAIYLVTKSKIIVDSSKIFPYLWILRMIPAVDLYVIHIIRHPQGFAFSYIRERPYPSGIHPGRYMEKNYPIRSALLWMFENIGIELVSPRKKYMRIYYEDFIMWPQKTIKNIVKFVNEQGNDLSFFMNERIVRLKACHTISGNPIRFKTGETELQLDAEWVYNMKRIDRFAVALLTYPLLLKYNYLSRGAIYRSMIK